MRNEDPNIEYDANDEVICCPVCSSCDMLSREEGWYDADAGYMRYNCRCAECGHEFESR